MMNEAYFDVLIIGCGVSGLASAIKLAEGGHKVGIVTREKDPHISNTYYAQGGIIFPKENDLDLVQDIYKASAKTNFDAAAMNLAVSGRKIVSELLLDKVKTDFEKSETGELLYTKEAAHSEARILYRGDYTGKEIQISLLNYLKDKSRFPNVTLLTAHTAIDLLTPLHQGKSLQERYEELKVVGAYVFNQEQNRVDKIISKSVILATGGIGSLYLHHTNSESARGDGHAMAKRAGAVITNMEFIQFHPTTFYDSSTHRRFLISEAVRGEGGILINSEGEAFMEKYHPDRELAPRDVVARAIVEETIATRHECVYLDISHQSEEWIKNRFPTIYKHCLKAKVDITKSPIPVVPAAHYTCGGVKVDLSGQTTLKNLYAVGEVSCSGLHGANRLASTSLLEGLVSGYQAAEKIMNEISSIPTYEANLINDWRDGKLESEDALIEQDWLTLRQTMWNYVGISRTSNRLKRADAMFSELFMEIQRFYQGAKLKDSLIGLRNAVEVGYLVLNSSSRNSESIGCFYRE